MTKAIRSNNIKNVLVTLNHIEQITKIKPRKFTKEFAVKFLKDKYHDEIKQIIVGQENHKDGGYHYHIGIHSNGLSRYTIIKNLKELYELYLGNRIHVSTTHRTFNTICNYITKEDKDPFCLGITLEEVNLNVKKAQKNKSRLQKSSHLKVKRSLNTQEIVIKNELGTYGTFIAKKNIAVEMRKRIDGHKSFENAFNDDFLQPLIHHNLKNFIAIYEMTHEFDPLPNVIQETLEFIGLEAEKLYGNRIKELFTFKKHAYSEEDIGEPRNVICKWLVENIFADRSKKQKYLYIWGRESNSGKTEIINAIGKWLTISRLKQIGNVDFFAPDENLNKAHLYFWDEAKINSHIVSDIKLLVNGDPTQLNKKGGTFTIKGNPPMVLVSNLPLYEGNLMERLRGIDYQNINGHEYKNLKVRFEVIHMEPDQVPNLKIDSFKLACTLMQLVCDEFHQILDKFKKFVGLYTDTSRNSNYSTVAIANILHNDLSEVLNKSLTNNKLELDSTKAVENIFVKDIPEDKVEHKDEKLPFNIENQQSSLFDTLSKIPSGLDILTKETEQVDIEKLMEKSKNGKLNTEERNIILAYLETKLKKENITGFKHVNEYINRYKFYKKKILNDELLNSDEEIDYKKMQTEIRKIPNNFPKVDDFAIFAFYSIIEFLELNDKK